MKQPLKLFALAVTFLIEQPNNAEYENNSVRKKGLRKSNNKSNRNITSGRKSKKNNSSITIHNSKKLSLITRAINTQL